MIEVRVPQDEWLAHLGQEKKEQLMKRAKEGHKVRVRICQPCNACYGCTLVNAGLSSKGSSGETHETTYCNLFLTEREASCFI